MGSQTRRNPKGTVLRQTGQKVQAKVRPGGHTDQGNPTGNMPGGRIARPAICRLKWDMGTWRPVGSLCPEKGNVLLDTHTLEVIEKYSQEQPLVWGLSEWLPDSKVQDTRGLGGEREIQQEGSSGRSYQYTEEESCLTLMCVLRRNWGDWGLRARTNHRND